VNSVPGLKPKSKKRTDTRHPAESPRTGIGSRGTTSIDLLAQIHSLRRHDATRPASHATLSRYRGIRLTYWADNSRSARCWWS